MLFKCICNEVFECEPEDFPGPKCIHLYDEIPRKGHKPPDPKEIVRKSIVATMQCLYRGSHGCSVLNQIQAQRRHAQKRASTTQDKEKAEQERGRDEQLGDGRAQEKEKRAKIAKSHPGAKAAATLLATVNAAKIVKGESVDIGLVANQILMVSSDWVVEYIMQFMILVALTAIAFGIYKLRSGVRKDAVRTDNIPIGGVIPSAPRRSRVVGEIDEQGICSWCVRPFSQNEPVQGCCSCNTRLCFSTFCYQRCRAANCFGSFAHRAISTTIVFILEIKN